MPSKTTSGKTKDSEKRMLVDALEALRGHSRDESEIATKSSPKPAKAGAPIGDDFQRLKMELKSSKATCDLLEEENRILEKKALSAIAEAGRLRMNLDKIDHERSLCKRFSGESETELIKEREELFECIKKAETERSLLTRAISDSEAEIARLCKTIDLLVKKVSILNDN